jgi:hypothetical protein
MPKMEADKKVVHESLRCVLHALVACMSLMMHEGHIGAVGGSASHTPSKKIQRECLG